MGRRVFRYRYEFSDSGVKIIAQGCTKRGTYYTLRSSRSAIDLSDKSARGDQMLEAIRSVESVKPS